MSDLHEQPLVIEWPVGKPLPLPGERFPAGEFGIGIVIETFVRHTHRDYPPSRLVAIEFYHPIP